VFGTRITLPSERVYEGQPGFYVGHLESGDFARFEDESVDAIL
jgi:hypothetical protein